MNPLLRKRHENAFIMKSILSISGMILGLFGAFAMSNTTNSGYVRLDGVCQVIQTDQSECDGGLYYCSYTRPIGAETIVPVYATPIACQSEIPYILKYE